MKAQKGYESCIWIEAVRYTVYIIDSVVWPEKAEDEAELEEGTKNEHHRGMESSVLTGRISVD